MHGCIKFQTGDVLWFNDSNFHEVIAQLSEKQKQQVADILHTRLGPKTESEFDVDPEVQEAWNDSVHRTDVKLGGGSRNGEAVVNKKGTKKLLRTWQDKGEGDKNITWLRNKGFKSHWKNREGYIFKKYNGPTIPTEWIQDLDHQMFKIKVEELLNEYDRVGKHNKTR